MKKSERLLAEKFLLQRIFEEDPDFVDHTMEKFGVARSTVYNYINHLQDTKELERVADVAADVALKAALVGTVMICNEKGRKK